ncbi:MAG: ABC transporter substrate-binding protein [Deltaproteobacteria bacterium]|jgi:phospholipid transport system substrate-binding protein|nr:ABC transporter substrate-binding protein [Deltaproteobacteria bacterium]
MKNAIYALCLLPLLMCASVYAAEKSEAYLLLDSKMDEVIAILNQPDFKNNQKNKALMQEVKDKIYSLCDFKEFSARSIGGAWRTFTPEQQDKLVEAFGELIYATYRNKLLDYNGQHFTFKKEIVSAKGDKVEIQTTFPLDNTAAAVNFRMLKKPEGWKIYDIIIEEVSMIQSYSNQFKEILKDGTPDKLIGDLQRQAREAMAK